MKRNQETTTTKHCLVSILNKDTGEFIPVFDNYHTMITMIEYGFCPACTDFGKDHRGWILSDAQVKRLKKLL